MAKTTTINYSTPDAHPSLTRYGQNLEAWPRSWMGFPKDILPGEKMVACFRPFLEYLIQQNLSRKTIRKHVDNLWILGGEIIRDLNQTPSLRKVPVEDLVFDVVKEGGPLLYHCDSEEQQCSFESTCRKFRRFLEQQPP
ncbi:MAG: hypothetical protein ACLQOO_25305 [Terriglobia bacterium]